MGPNQHYIIVNQVNDHIGYWPTIMIDNVAMFRLTSNFTQNACFPLKLCHCNIFLFICGIKRSAIGVIAKPGLWTGLDWTGLDWTGLDWEM